MKSKFLKIAFAAALAVVSGVTAYQAQDKAVMSDLALANVEALAGIEIDFGDIGNKLLQTTHTRPCPYPLDYKSSVYCTDGGSEHCYPSDC